MNLAEWLCRTASRTPSSPAILQGPAVVHDYAALTTRAASIGAGLARDSQVTPGDRVALLLPNCTHYLELMYGAWFAGAAVVPINWKLHPREAAWVISHSGAKVVFAQDKYAGMLEEFIAYDQHQIVVIDSDRHKRLLANEPLPRPRPRGRDDLAWLFYTSGTTGKPKGAMLSHGNLAAMTLSYFVDVDDVSELDAALYAAPMSHGAGLYNFMHVLRGAKHIVPESQSFDADEIFDIAKRVGRISMFAAPTMVRLMIDKAALASLDGAGLKTVVYGGGPMYVADIEDAVSRLGPRFVQIYGQGECPMTITALPRYMVADRSNLRWRERLASVGQPHSCVEVSILGESGGQMETGETGEVVVRGAPVMLGYWNDPEETARALRDGWLWTGDMGSFDQDGFLTLKDRSRDLIISAGTNIYPREVEEALLLHPSVREAAVIGRPDPHWGEMVVAFIVGDVSEDDLDAHCLRHIARFKRPKHYRFVQSLPKNNYGKVLKTELREQDRHTRFDGTKVPQLTEV